MGDLDDLMAKVQAHHDSLPVSKLPPIEAHARGIREERARVVALLRSERAWCERHTRGATSAVDRRYHEGAMRMMDIVIQRLSRDEAGRCVACGGGYYPGDTPAADRWRPCVCGDHEGTEGGE